MSGLRRFSDGRKPEKSNFVQTCNLLSRYIKERGSLRDLNIEIGRKVESLESIVKPGSTYSASASTTRSVLLRDKGKSALRSVEQQPPMAPISSINTVEEPRSEKPTETESESAQLTIFYSGQVLVFEDYPSDKAKELVMFAKKQSSQMSCGILSNTLGEKPRRSSAVASISCSREGLPPRPQASTSSQAVGISSNACKEKISTSSGGAGRVTPQHEANDSDLPIARRSSLHRFLEKRKDRAAARGPYHQVEEQPSSSSKADEQLELRL